MQVQSNQSIQNQNLKRLTHQVIRQNRASGQLVQKEIFIHLPFPKKSASENINDLQKQQIISSWGKLHPISQKKVIEDLNQQISDKTISKSDRHDTLKKLILVDENEATKTIINAYILPENTDMRSVFRKALIKMIRDSDKLKTFAVKKLTSKALSSVDGLAQKLLDEICPPVEVKIPRTYLQAATASFPMSSTTALGLTGTAFAFSGVESLRESGPNIPSGWITLATGGIFLLESVRQIYSTK